MKTKTVNCKQLCVTPIITHFLTYFNRQPNKNLKIISRFGLTIAQSFIIICNVLRIWRNWQTRRFQVPVGDRAGSTPVIRTKIRGRLMPSSYFGYVIVKQQELMVETRAGASGLRTDTMLAAQLTQTEQRTPAVHRGAPPKAQLLLSAPKYGDGLLPSPYFVYACVCNCKITGLRAICVRIQCYRSITTATVINCIYGAINSQFEHFP